MKSALERKKEALPAVPAVLKIPHLSQSEFGQIQRLILKLSGVSLAENKTSLVSGRLMKRLREYECSRYQDYIDIVQNPANESERNIFIDLLTTHETHFFRESPHFDLLARLARAHNSSRPFRFWSAACSSGEEAYSAAMVLHGILGEGGYQIFATDVSEGTLAIGRKGHYPMAAAQGIPEQYLKQFCLRGTGSMTGLFRVKTEIQEHIKFARMNLLEPWAIEHPFDAIFLRNVMIYFDTETKRQLASRIKSLLVPDGVLVVGHAESLTGLIPDLSRFEQSVYRITR